MAEYLEYDCIAEKIPDQDRPEPGMIYISKGYGFEAWIVAEWQGRILGIFYHGKEFARIFAKAL